MKKGYYIFFGKSNSSGVSKKVNMQLEELEKYFSVKLINVPKIERGIIRKLWGLFFWVSNKYDYDLLFESLMEPDFLYIRYTLSDKKTLYFLQKVRGMYPQCKIIIELFTYPYDREYWHRIDFLFLIKDMYYRRKLKQYVDRFVTYSRDEIILGIPTIRTMNGIDIKKIRKIEPIVHDENEIHMIGVAMLQKHHGYERLIMGMRNYYSDNTYGKCRKVFFHIVGDGPEKKRYERLVKKYSLGDNVIFHGMLEGEQLDEIYNQSDLAISSLGIYKAKVYYLSALKTREYLAKGLPMITGSKVDVLSHEFPYYLEFPNDSSVIDVESIIHFHDKVYFNSYNRAGIVNYIRKFAEEKVNMDIVMQPIIEYINES